ncbi:hypothetical protein LTR86_004907 [Recurvomyces mirabilis]|nr:hypothetical protein LTR86_004907 [Recurvomyces mirabilis]
MLLSTRHLIPSLILSLPVQTFAQNQCYYASGAKGPSNLVPCNPSGQSSCCLLGDICLSGNACYDFTTGDTYQYGCTDSNYQDSTCPYKCGWDSTRSPYTTLVYCSDIPDPNTANQNISNTWVCLSPESCGCSWGPSSQSLQVLPPRDCKDMGDKARVALYAPLSLAPWVQLPTSNGGSTGYWRSTMIGGSSSWAGPISGYTPSPVRELTTYQDGPSSAVRAGGGAVGGLSTTSSTSSTTPSPSSTATSTGGSGASSSATLTIVPSGSPSAGGSTPTITDVPSSTAPIRTDISPATASPSISSSASSSSAAAAGGGLTKGDKAGIGIGVPAAICLLLLALGFFLWRRRHRKAQTERLPQSMPFVPPQPEQPMQELSTPTLPYYNGPLPGTPDGKPGGWQSGTGTPRPEPVEKMHEAVQSGNEMAGYAGQNMMYARGDLSQRPHDVRSLASTRGPPTPSPAYEDAIRQT